ncbi:hypothetical protein MARBORIA2_08590 [Methanobrevibacter arboriphilus]|jgi:hypothetical protein|nr:hypothetical protein [Methanobrevibacter arboriphilus]GLI11769.1 hypothetical protein MARBORIA2_08590 [Methanobrevibacter arboriphilus]
MLLIFIKIILLILNSLEISNNTIKFSLKTSENLNDFSCKKPHL